MLIERLEEIRAGKKLHDALMVKLVDTRDLKSLDPEGSCGSESRLGYKIFKSHMFVF